MSILLNENNKKYVMDWESPSSVLKVMEFEPTTWNAQSQQYNYSLINTYTFGGGAVSPVWGSWFDTTTQTTTVNTPTPMYCDSIVNQSGILKKFGSNFEVQTSGWYNVQFSAQLDQASGAGHHIYIWLRKNGIDVPNSASEIAIQGTTAECIAAWNWFIDLNAGDYVNIMYYVDNAAVQIKAATSNGIRPAIPSVILTMNKIANL
jgi:hypothetical protein